MLIPLLSGTLPGWPEAAEPNWLLLLALCVGLPLLVLGLFWALGSGRYWRTGSSAVATADAQRAIEQHADGLTVNALEARDETTPDGPNRAVAQRAILETSGN